MEFSNDEKEKLNEILSLPTGTVKEAILWWNKEASEATKRLVVVSAYYEVMLMDVEKSLENIDFFEGLEKNGE